MILLKELAYGEFSPDELEAEVHRV
jgi:hypothetical protein